jgi:hypothetical protein
VLPTQGLSRTGGGAAGAQAINSPLWSPAFQRASSHSSKASAAGVGPERRGQNIARHHYLPPKGNAMRSVQQQRQLRRFLAPVQHGQSGACLSVGRGMFVSWAGDRCAHPGSAHEPTVTPAPCACMPCNAHTRHSPPRTTRHSAAAPPVTRTSSRTEDEMKRTGGKSQSLLRFLS